MDILSSSGLINYFGKWTDITKVSIAPLVFQKGQTTVALYGLSYMNDLRLSRLMRNKKVIQILKIVILLIKGTFKLNINVYSLKCYKLTIFRVNSIFLFSIKS